MSLHAASTLCIAAVIAIGAIAGAAAAQDEAIGPRTAANDAVTLEELLSPDPQSREAPAIEESAGPPAPEPTSQAAAQRSEAAATEQAVAQRSEAAGLPQQAIPYEPPPQETIPLGAPRQAAVETAPQSQDAGWKQRLQSLDPRANGITRVIGALAVVLGLIVLLRVVFMRSGRLLNGARRPSGVLEVLGRYPIAKGQQLVLIKLARRVILVHQTGATMSTLSEVTEADEVAGLLARIEAGSGGGGRSGGGRSGGRGKSFQTLLDHYNDEHGEPPEGPLRSRRNEPQVIDLTRRSTAKRLLGKSRATT